MSKVKITMNIDEELKKELKIIAIQQDTTVTKILTKIIREYIDENKK